MRKTILLLFLVILQGCNNLTMVDVYRENLSDEADGSISEMVKAKGGNATLKIYKDGKFKSVGVNAEIFYLVKIGDGFIKKKNSNKCLVKRNDSLICLDCYTLSKEIKDSLGLLKNGQMKKKDFGLRNINSLPLTHATSDLGNWLNLKMVLYLKDLANPKIRLYLIPNRL